MLQKYLKICAIHSMILFGCENQSKRISFCKYSYFIEWLGLIGWGGEQQKAIKAINKY